MLMLRQDGVCAICHQTCSTGRMLAIDHDHDSGSVRGLLCSKCNPGIGFFQHDSARLESAIAYLKEWA